MHYYLDYDTGLLYHDRARTRLVETIAVKYGDSLPVYLYILSQVGMSMDVGTDTIRFGAAINGTQALFIPGFTYSPLLSGTVLTPRYAAVLTVATVPLQTALTSRASVHLEGEFTRETYEGRHISSQTVTVHVASDIVQINNPPEADPAADYATEVYVRNTIAGVTAGNLPGFDLGTVTMEPANATPVGALDYDEATHKYRLDLRIPVTPGKDGAPGATPTLEAGTFTTTDPGTAAVFRMRFLGDNHYAVDISLPLNKGDKGDKGDNALPPTITVGTVTEGDAPAATLVANGVNAYKLNLVFVRGDKGDKGDTGIAPPIQIGDVRTTDEASAWMDYDEVSGYMLNLNLPRGSQGLPGIQGATGPAPTIQIGSVSTSNTAAASITPVGATGYKLNLELPRGHQGDAGPPPSLVKGDIFVLAPGSDPYFNVRAAASPGKYYIDMGLPSGGGSGGAGTPAQAYILSTTSDSTLTLTCRTDDPSSLHPDGATANVPLNYHIHSVNKDGYTCRRTHQESRLYTSPNNSFTMANQPPPDMQTAAQWFQPDDNTNTNYFSGAHHTHIVDGPGGKSYATTGPSGEIWWTWEEGGICMQEHQHAVLIPS